MTEKIVIHSSKTDVILAGPEHNEIIWEINEKVPWDGLLSYVQRYGAKPHETFTTDGFDGDVLLLRDTESGVFFGFGACSMYNMYVNGEIRRVGYYNVMKVLPEYQKRIMSVPLLLKGCFQTVDGRIDLGFMISFDGEEELMNFYKKKRKFGPSFNLQSRKFTVCIKPSKKLMNIPGMEIQEGNTDGLEEFYKRNSARFNFGPVYEDMLKRERIWITMRKDGKVKGACSIINNKEARGYYINGYAGLGKLVSVLPLNLFGYPHFPPAGDLADNATLSMIMFDEDVSVDEMTNFIKNASYYARDYALCFFATTDTDPLYGTLKKLKCVHFDGVVFSVDWDEDLDLTDRPIYIDESRL